MLLMSGPLAMVTSTHSKEELSGALYIISVMAIVVTVSSTEEDDVAVAEDVADEVSSEDVSVVEDSEDSTVSSEAPDELSSEQALQSAMAQTAEPINMLFLISI